MSEISDALIDGLLELEESCQTTLVWAGSSYACSGGPELKGKSLDIGGYKFTADCVLIVRQSVFGTGAAVPAPKQTVGFLSAPEATQTNWRIDSVQTLHNAIIVLSCNSL